MEVEIAPDAVAELETLPSRIIARIDAMIFRLRDWPNVSGTKRLTGKLKGSFRIRTGDYRILFRLDGHRIVVWRIANRRDVYED